jgi:hypothetical protein
MFIVSSTGKVQQMNITDVSKPFVLIHEVIKKDLTDLGLTDLELSASMIIKGFIQDGTLVKFYDYDKFNGYSQDNFNLIPIVPIQEQVNETGETVSGGINDKNYIHNQTVSSTNWIVNHNLNKFVSPIIQNDNNEVISCSWNYLSINQIQVTPDIPITGKVFCN